jgi:hypothetical protein
MASKLLISVSAEQATAGIFRNGQLGVCQVFRNDAHGLMAFDRFLSGLRRMPACLLLDVVEEDYRCELLPHAIGRDRGELRQRRLRQLYRDTPYRGGLRQGRDSGKRGDDQHLFFGLLNPELLDVWLSPIHARALPVAGIYLLPLVSEQIARKIGPNTQNILLVSRHAAGLRLSFFRDGRLRASRLTRIESAGTQRHIGELTEEIVNTRLYLHSLHAMALDEALTVIALDRDDSLGGLQQTVTQEIAHANVIVIDPGELARQSGVPAPVIADVPDALYLHLLASRAMRGNLAPESIKQRFRIYRSRRMLYVASAIAVIAAASGLGLNTRRLYDLRSQQTQTALQTASYQHRYQEITRQFPASPATADNLMQAVRVAEKLRASKGTPEPAMALIGRVLGQYPNVRLKAMGWKHRPDDQASDTGQPLPNAQTTGPDASGANGRGPSAFVDAEIHPFNSDYRAALDEINAIAASLRQNPTVAAVRIAALPLNVSPAMALSGSATNTAARAANAPFRLDLIFKSTP